MNRKFSSPLSGQSLGPQASQSDKGSYGLQPEPIGLRGGSAQQLTTQHNTGDAFGLDAEAPPTRKPTGGFGLDAEVSSAKPHLSSAALKPANRLQSESHGQPLQQTNEYGLQSDAAMPAKGSNRAGLYSGNTSSQKPDTFGLHSEVSSPARPSSGFGLHSETSSPARSTPTKTSPAYGLQSETSSPDRPSSAYGLQSKTSSPARPYGLQSEASSSARPSAGYGLQPELPSPAKPSTACGLQSEVSSPARPSSGYGLQSEVSSPARPSSGYGLQSEVSSPASPRSGYGLQSEVPSPARPSSGYGMQFTATSPGKPTSAYGLQSEISSPGRSNSTYRLQSEISSPARGGTAYGLEAETSTQHSSPYGLQSEVSQANSQRVLSTPPHSPHSQTNSQSNYTGMPHPSGGSFSSQSSPNTDPYASPSGDYTTTEFRPLSAQLSQQSFSSSPPRPGSASVSPRCQVVDIKAAAGKFWDSIGPQPHLYLEALSACTPNKQFPENARPSILQTKLKQGRNTIRSILLPSGQAPGSAQTQAPHSSTSTQQLPDPGVQQFSFSLVTAKNVGLTGLARQRQPCVHVARMCMLDKSSSRFVGNVWTVNTTEVKNESTWAFDSTDFCIIRYSTTGCDNGSKRVTDPADLSLFIELNISHKLTLEDAAIMPDSERKAAKMVDEVNTCWALINLQRCADLAKEMEVAVPLYCSNLYSPTALDQLVQQERKKHPVKSFFKPVKPAVLIFRAGPLPGGAKPLLPYSLMPSNVVASPDMCIVLAAFRAALAEQQAVYGPMPCGDPALASFPKIVADNLLLQHFMARWCATTDLQHKIAKGGICCSNSSKEAPPTIDQVVELWRRLCLDVAPLLHAQALPPPHINNFLEYQAHRKSMLDNFTVVVDPITGRATGKQRPPVEPLSHAAYEWLHKPFDVREIRFALPAAW